MNASLHSPPPSPPKKFIILYLLVGLPGSQKTTWLNKRIKKSISPSTFIVSKHDFLKAPALLPSQQREQKVDLHKRVYEKVRKIMYIDSKYTSTTCIEIYVDDDNLNYHEWMSYRLLAPDKFVMFLFPSNPQQAIVNIPAAITAKTDDEYQTIFHSLKEKWELLNESLKYKEKIFDENYIISTPKPPTPPSPPPSPVFSFLLSKDEKEKEEN